VFYLFYQILNNIFQNCFQQGLEWVIMFNATFNYISVILWRSVLLVEDTGVPGFSTESRKIMAMRWESILYYRREQFRKS